MEESRREVRIGPGGRREIGRNGGGQETGIEARRDSRREAGRRESGPIGIRGRKDEGGRDTEKTNQQASQNDVQESELTRRTTKQVHAAMYSA